MDDNQSRNITVHILDKKFGLKASDAASEARIRKAATIVSKKIEAYRSNFIDCSEIDLLSFVALNECIRNLKLSEKIDEAQQAEDALCRDIQSYLEQ